MSKRMQLPLKRLSFRPQVELLESRNLLSFGPPANFPLKQSGSYQAINTALLSQPYDIPQLGQFGTLQVNLKVESIGRLLGRGPEHWGALVLRWETLTQFSPTPPLPAEAYIAGNRREPSRITIVGAQVTTRAS